MFVIERAVDLMVAGVEWVVGFWSLFPVITQHGEATKTDERVLRRCDVCYPSTGPQRGRLHRRPGRQNPFLLRCAPHHASDHIVLSSRVPGEAGLVCREEYTVDESDVDQPHVAVYRVSETRRSRGASGAPNGELMVGNTMRAMTSPYTRSKVSRSS
jgi:hypothetical protein